MATVGLVPDGVVTGPVVDVLVEEVEAPVPGAEVVVPAPVLVPAADGVVVLVVPVVPAVPEDVDGHGLVFVVPPIGVVGVDGVTVVPGVAVELPVLCPGTVVVVEPTPPDGNAGGMPPDGAAGGMPPDGTPDGF
ncbi:MAG TPA: hypothetical protein VKT33_14740 [Candidatus Angelobacter sp.]|nr:hypothetical protein [Candidatus Angelobacter sp.]